VQHGDDLAEALASPALHDRPLAALGDQMSLAADAVRERAPDKQDGMRSGPVASQAAA